MQELFQKIYGNYLFPVISPIAYVTTALFLILAVIFRTPILIICFAVFASVTVGMHIGESLGTHDATLTCMTMMLDMNVEEFVEMHKTGNLPERFSDPSYVAHLSDIDDDNDKGMKV